MVRRLSGAGVALVLLLVFAQAATPPALGQLSGWYVAGSAQADDGGQVYSSARLPANLVADGLTYVRVTSGPCDGEASDYVVYEAALAPETGGSQLYAGVLEPIGRFATPLSNPPGAYNAFLFGRGASGGFTIVLENQTPGVTFTACFRGP